MSDRRHTAVKLALGLVALVVALGAGGCAKKLVSVDASLVPPGFPEGTRDSLQNTPSDLVVWPDDPNQVTDVFGPDTSVYGAYRSGPGAVIGAIVDYRGTNGYLMFRREVGGGFRQFQDFALPATRRWADRDHYGTPQGDLVLPPAQLFAFSDPAPPAIPHPDYIGRAVVSGRSSADYPLTNLGEVSSGVGRLTYRGEVTPPDSLFDIRWDAVPGAAGYWVHIFQYRADIQSAEEAIEVGLPAPIAIGKVRDLFIGYFPAALTSFKLGSPVPTGSRILVYRVLLGGQAVLVRVSAVDSAGQLISAIRDNGDFGAYQERIAQVDRRRSFPLGAVVVTPLILRPVAQGPARAGWQTIDAAVPGLTYHRRVAFPGSAASR